LQRYSLQDFQDLSGRVYILVQARGGGMTHEEYEALPRCPDVSCADCQAKAICGCACHSAYGPHLLDVIKYEIGWYEPVDYSQTRVQ